MANLSTQEIIELAKAGISDETILKLAGVSPDNTTPEVPGEVSGQGEGAPAPTPEVKDADEVKEHFLGGEPKKPEVPFGGGQMQETFNKMLEQMQASTEALTKATQAQQASNAAHISMGNGSPAEDIVDITASIIDPSYSKNKGGN